MSEGGGEPDSDRPRYSTAFDKMTEGDADDPIGLMAYALYKKMIKEDVLEGSRISGVPKDPSPDKVRFYREAAAQRLENFASISIDEARAEIQESAVLNTLEARTSEIKQHISGSTGPIRAIVTNVVAWAFTLIITLIVLLITQPDRVAKYTGQAAGSVAPEPQVDSPQVPRATNR
ncbi:hypothetical protein [Loktanella atrilutea]|uniref:hypothetical protein n=1 Tax=Loktanella atrilutea TaxID=366533 RepID=UPI0011601616|nr:hypothetical protein [Loktanella atrilutea]